MNAKRYVALAHLAMTLFFYGIAFGEDKLSDRFDRVSCSVVQVIHNEGMGSGFFISADGDVVTAAHVGLNRVFSEPIPGALRIDIDYKPGLRIIRPGHPPEFLSLPKLQPSDVVRATSDLVILKTGVRTKCYLPLTKHPADMRVGRHVIAVGYPLSAPSGALYEGFISAEYRHLEIPIATVNNKAIYPTYTVIRIQMPITPGVSGAPVIGDDGEVIGVVTESPAAWLGDLNNLIQFEQVQQGGFNAPVSDVPKMLAKLAWVVQEYLTSGAGLAVPVSYLKISEQMGGQPAKPKSPNPGDESNRGLFRALRRHLNL